jgi:hypothetical protein
MLLRSVLAHSEDLAVVILVLQDVCVLLSLQPRVLEVEQNRLRSVSPLQKSFHGFSVGQVSCIHKALWRAFFRVSVRLPLGVGEVFEVLVDLQVVASLLFGLEASLRGGFLSAMRKHSKISDLQRWVSHGFSRLREAALSAHSTNLVVALHHLGILRAIVELLLAVVVVVGGIDLVRLLVLGI